MESKENPPPYQPSTGPNQQPHQGPPPNQQGYPQPQHGYPGPNQGYPPQQHGHPPPHQGYPPPHQGYPPPHQGYPQPMPMQQQQQQQNTTVVIQQPTATNTVLQVAPPDHFVRAILACFFCFWPTGLIAMYFAHRSRELFAQGDVSASYRMANNARNLIIVSVLLGLGWIILVIVLQTVNTTTTTYNQY